MGVDKSLEEVREWKDKIYEEDKNLTDEQIFRLMFGDYVKQKR